jgi:hypothetical protein
MLLNRNKLKKIVAKSLKEQKEYNPHQSLLKGLKEQYDITDYSRQDLKRLFSQLSSKEKKFLSDTFKKIDVIMLQMGDLNVKENVIFKTLYKHLNEIRKFLQGHKN